MVYKSLSFLDIRHEAFTVKIQLEVFLVVMPCSVVVGYQCFRDPYCLHLQDEVTTTLQSVTTQKTST